MKKNSILMSALFAGTMLINDGLAFVQAGLEDFANESINDINYNEHLIQFTELRIGLLNKSIEGHNFRHENNGGYINETKKHCAYLAAVYNLYPKLTEYAIQHNLLQDFNAIHNPFADVHQRVVAEGIIEHILQDENLSLQGISYDVSRANNAAIQTLNNYDNDLLMINTKSGVAAEFGLEKYPPDIELSTNVADFINEENGLKKHLELQLNTRFQNELINYLQNNFGLEELPEEMLFNVQSIDFKKPEIRLNAKEKSTSQLSIILQNHLISYLQNTFGLEELPEEILFNVQGIDFKNPEIRLNAQKNLESQLYMILKNQLVNYLQNTLGVSELPEEILFNVQSIDFKNPEKRFNATKMLEKQVNNLLTLSHKNQELEEAKSGMQYYWNSFNQTNLLLQRTIGDIIKPFKDFLQGKVTLVGCKTDADFFAQYMLSNESINDIKKYYESNIKTYDTSTKSERNFKKLYNNYTTMMNDIRKFHGEYDQFLNYYLSELYSWRDVIQNNQALLKDVNDVITIIETKYNDLLQIIQDSENILRSFTDYFKNEIIIR